VKSIEEFWCGFVQSATPRRMREHGTTDYASTGSLKTIPAMRIWSDCAWSKAKSPVNVNCVTRLSEGLDSLTRVTPSVVLLDLNLPDSHGAETFSPG